MVLRQDKSKEIAFFDSHASAGEYDVFSDRSKQLLIDSCMKIAGVKPQGRLADLGCGSGVFTSILQQRGFTCTGLDISHQLALRGARMYPHVAFLAGDIEYLPYASATLDAVLLSGVIHHLPDPLPCALEIYRVLKPGGVFMAFDPNRRNPFMWLYRDKSSPLYSSNGVTENERPILAEEVYAVFTEAGFDVRNDFLSGLHYRYIASAVMRVFLPVYNTLDSLLFSARLLKRFRPFVLTAGVKP